MKLLVVRHAIAMERVEFAATGNPDDLRPLTEKGARKMARIARGLKNEVETLDILATSPLTRAVETARIVADAYDMGEAQTTDALVPEATFEEFEGWCSKINETGVVAVVGHEPHLSSLVTWLLTGRPDSRVELKKGGACLLEFESVVRRDAGTLSWLLAPRQLTKMTD